MAEQKNRPGILLLSHGELCAGILDSVKMLVGDVEGVIALSLKVGQDVDMYGEMVEECYEQMPEGSIILVDLFGGSPANVAAKLASKRKVYAAAGLNLGMVISALMAREKLSGTELLTAVVEDGKKGIVNIWEMFQQIENTGE